MKICTKKKYSHLRAAIVILRTDEQRVAKTSSDFFELDEGEQTVRMVLATDCLADGNYFCEIGFIDSGKNGEFVKYCGVYNAFYFSILNKNPLRMDIPWNQAIDGNVVLPISQLFVNKD